MSVERIIKDGERTMRWALWIAQEGREKIAAVLKHARDEMDAGTIVTAESDVRQFDKVIEYVSRAPSTLPTPQQERLGALHEALTNMQLLAADR
jgi:hypothetical protein